jgi:hypothetical protein
MEFFPVDDSLLYPDHGKLLTMAEVIAQPSFNQWYGYFKGLRFRHGFLRCWDFCGFFSLAYLFRAQGVFHLVHAIHGGLDEWPVVRRFLAATIGVVFLTVAHK